MAKTVYFTDPESGKVKSFYIDDIDANDAVQRFPNQYSFSAPVKAEIEEVKTPQAAVERGEPLPNSAIGGTDAAPDNPPAA